jgi:P-type Ca2+ transporter type 2C
LKTTSPAKSSNPEIIYHTLPVTEIYQHFAVDPEKGLDKNTADQRLATYGPNTITEAKVVSPMKLFFRQFDDLLIIILIIAALISGVILKELVDTAAIVVILLLNAVLGFIQEYRAEHALAALKKMLAPITKVLRQGFEQELPAEKLVPGDIVIINTGDRIPADCRIVESKLLAIDESSLTGESIPVDKQTEPLPEADLSLGDCTNMCYTGTMVTRGRGKAVVIGTGMNTEMGRIVELLEQPKEKTPLQNELKKMGTRIAYICLGISIVVLISGVLKQHSWIEMFLIAISLAVAAIPEGLPAAVTVALSLGVKRMAEKNAIVRRLHAVETLGSTSFIGSDKTGTLTMNQMRVERIAVDNKVYNLAEALQSHSHFHELFLSATLCNDTKKTIDGKMMGDPTEIGLIVAAQEFGIALDKAMLQYPRIAEIPFDSERKAMSTIHQDHRGFHIFVKGAPEVILPMCLNISISDWQTINNNLTKDGFRTLAFATKTVQQITTEIKAEAIEKELNFLGLIGMSDPPRDEVKQAVETSKQAGIKVAMITGDHKLTAENIGRRIGLLADGKVVTGPELERMSSDSLASEIDHIQVYARVSPIQKVKIVRALKQQNHIVAMTGDGVNDAPALKLADIGVAMGITGTDVAKEASDMVLADDNFATIVNAVKEGRVIFENLKKFALYLVSCNISEVLTILFAMLANLPVLYPIQILWTNLITDGLPALALGVDPAEPDLMLRPPRNPNESILSGKNLLFVFLQGLILALSTIITMLFSRFGLKVDDAQVRTIVFTALVSLQLFHAFNFRVGKNFYFSHSLFANKYLIGSFLLSVLLQTVIIFVRPFNSIFNTVPLNINLLGVLLIIIILTTLATNAVHRLFTTRKNSLN